MSTQSGDSVRMAKPRDAWWTVIFVDPIAIPLTRVIAKYTPLTPNMVTVLANIVGLFAGVAFLQGMFLAGGLLYQVAFLLDCVDGKLARLKGLSSPIGAFLDWIFDRTMDIYCVICLAVGTYQVTSSPTVFILALVWLGLFTIRYLIHLHLDGSVSHRKQTFSEQATRRGLLQKVSGHLARYRLQPFPGTIEVYLVTFTLGPAFGKPLYGLLVGVAAFSAMVLVGLLTAVRTLTK